MIQNEIIVRNELNQHMKFGDKYALIAVKKVRKHLLGDNRKVFQKWNIQSKGYQQKDMVLKLFGTECFVRKHTRYFYIVIYRQMNSDEH